MRPSSIFSSESWQVRLRGAWWMAMLAAMLLIAELLLRLPVVQGWLPAPEPTLWHAELIDTKVSYFDEFAASRELDVLFIGNSTMQAGLNPATFDQNRGVAETAVPGSFNGSIEGLPPYGVAMFLEMYLREANPQMIVYGLTPQDLNANSPWAADITDRVKHSPMLLAEARQGVKGQLIAFLLDHSQLYRYRLVLYRLVLGDGSLRQDTAVYFDERGYHALEARLADVPASERGGYYGRAGVLNYDTAGVQLDKLRQIIERVQGAGIQLVLLNMPLADDYYGNFDDAAADYAEYLAALTAVATAYNVPVVDYEQGKTALLLDDDHFADFNHLNQDGAARLSAAMAQQYLTMTAQP